MRLRTYATRDARGNHVTVHGTVREHDVVGGSRTDDHLAAAGGFVAKYGAGLTVCPTPVGTTARGFVYTTTTKKESPEMDEGTTVTQITHVNDKAEVTRDLVEGWRPQWRFGATSANRLDWKATVVALADAGIVLPADSRHPVCTKVQRIIRELQQAEA